MTETRALEILQKMDNTEFDAFFAKLPERTKMTIRAGFAKWEKVLPAWYIKLGNYKHEK